MAGIYIHIPFCKTRCIYCDFYSNTDFSNQDKFVDAICKEIELRKNYLALEPIQTIYFGGGTPSTLKIDHFKKIFNIIYDTFDVNNDAEITIEANPDDLDEPYICQLRQNLPFNRISMGVQSFDDNELHFLKRRHSAQKAIWAVETCKQYGFTNISIDLIYGLPKQTIDIWNANIDKAISLDINHISSYHLIYEDKTLITKFLHAKKITPVDEELSNTMFDTLINKLEDNGFEHYEISNFARPGYISKHNSSYWLGKNYLGLGPAAHSFNGTERSFNKASLKDYLNATTLGKILTTSEQLDLNATYNEFIITGLRTYWGIDLNKMKELFGNNYVDYCINNATKYIQQDLLKIVQHKMILTRKGVFISDGIMSDLLKVD